MVVAAAGLGSVLAAYIDVLPSPIQQLAHEAAGAPAPHGPGSRPPVTLGTGRPAARKAPPSSQPAPAPRHAPSSAAAPSAATTPTHYRPAFSPSGHHPTEPGCRPSPGRSPYQPPEGPPGPTPPPWYRTAPCPAVPTGPAGLPTWNPHAPLPAWPG